MPRLCLGVSEGKELIGNLHRHLSLSGATQQDLRDCKDDHFSMRKQ